MSAPSSSNFPLTCVNSPFTFEIMMCRTLNCAAECAGSIIHVLVATSVDSPLLKTLSRMALLVGHRGLFLFQIVSSTSYSISLKPAYLVQTNGSTSILESENMTMRFCHSR